MIEILKHSRQDTSEALFLGFDTPQQYWEGLDVNIPSEFLILLYIFLDKENNFHKFSVVNFGKYNTGRYLVLLKYSYIL